MNKVVESISQEAVPLMHSLKPVIVKQEVKPSVKSLCVSEYKVPPNRKNKRYISVGTPPRGFFVRRGPAVHVGSSPRPHTAMEAVKTAGYNIDISDIDTSDLTDDERISLQKELEDLFQPRSDPADLPKDLQIMAENQVLEKPGLLHQNIIALRELIKQDERLNARTDDLFLAAFLRGRKHDVEKAFRCVKNFYEFGNRYPDMYGFLYPSENPEVFDQNHFGSLPGTDRKGRKICAIIPYRLKPDEIPVLESFKMGRSVLELMLMDIRLQVAGTCVIFDMGGLSFLQQARLITPTICWHLAMCVQDKIPMRLKAVHIVNQPTYFNAIHAIFKRLLKKKLRKRIFLHGTDYKSLHEHIAPEELPEEWGGTRKPFTGTLTKTLLQLNEHRFRDWDEKGYKDDECYLADSRI